MVGEEPWNGGDVPLREGGRLGPIPTMVLMN